MASTNKRRSTSGYSRENMDAQVQSIMRHDPKPGGWRRVEKRSKVVMTYLLQKCFFNNEEIGTVKHLCPWGMVNTITQLLKNPKCKRKVVLPSSIKSVIHERNLDYKESLARIEVENTGPSAPREYYHVFCRTCETDKELLPALLSLHLETLGPNPNVFSLIRNFDALKISIEKIDFCGCFLPWEPDVEAGPNARRFLREPGEHVGPCHVYTKEVSAKAAAQKRKTQSKLIGASSSKKSADVIIVSDPEKKQSSYGTVTNYQKSMKQRTMDAYNTKIDLLGKCKSPVEEFGKGTCLSVVHTGVNKMISNAAIIDNYKCTFQSLEDFHSFSEKSTGVKIPKPVEISLNKDNISRAQLAILDAYRYDNDESPYQKLVHSPFWSVTHDGISKFSHEYNGVMLRGITEDLNPLHVPYGLRKMRGGVNAHDTVNDMIAVISEYLDVKQSAFDTVITELNEAENTPDDVIRPISPTYFKLGKLLHIDVERKEIHIKLHKNMPVANTGDGVSVNKKAARIMMELYGLKSPDFRCAAHIASGTVKRVTTSKTMNVPELTTLYETLRTIVKHFECSIKNKEILDQAMENLELTPLHLMSWCQTRMAHFLTACQTINTSLPALYDVMASLNVREDERDILFTAQNIYLLKLMASLEPSFMETFLRPSDKTDLLVSEVFHIAECMVSKVESLDTPDADKFAESLRFDENGNMMADLIVKDNIHEIRLSHHSKPTRGEQREVQLNKVKTKVGKLKESLLENVVTNIRDQNSEDSWYWNWSGLDLQLPLSLEQRIQRLRELIRLYTTEFVNIKQKYYDAKDKKTEPDLWEDHEVHLHHQKVLDCSEEQLVEELKKAWPVVNSMWMSECNRARNNNCQPKQHSVWKKLQNERFTEFPNSVRFIQIMVSTPANTSPLERSFTKLQIVAAKRRNHFTPSNLEVLYLLASYNQLCLPRRAHQYENEIARLALK